MVGYFIGYSKTEAEYRVILGDTMVTFCLMRLSPERSAGNFRELDEFVAG